MATSSDYSKSHNNLMKFYSKFFMIFFGLLIVFSYIVVIYKEKTFSFFSISLLTVAMSLFIVNFCSILGICPKNCSLVNVKNKQEKCIYTNGIYTTSILLGMGISFIISIIIVFQKEKFELPEMPKMPEMPEIKLPEAVQETLDEIEI
jgi:magnesium-transporting ATPase (P-type)